MFPSTATATFPSTPGDIFRHGRHFGKAGEPPRSVKNVEFVPNKSSGSSSFYHVLVSFFGGIAHFQTLSCGPIKVGTWSMKQWFERGLGPEDMAVVTVKTTNCMGVMSNAPWSPTQKEPLPPKCWWKRGTAKRSIGSIQWAQTKLECVFLS